MATWYINADTGNDTTGDGSSGNPWLNVSKAHTMASSGDTIVCMDSTADYAFGNQTFTKNLTVTGQQDDASGARFYGAYTLRQWNTSPATVVLNVSKLTFYGSPRPTSYNNNISTHQGIIDSCVFYDSSSTSATTAAPGFVGTDILSGSEVNDLTISNCLFYGMTGTNPTVTGGHHTSGANDTGTFLFEGNTIYIDGVYSYATPTIVGVYSWGSITPTFRNNIIYCAVDGVDFVRSGQAGLFTYYNNSTYNVGNVSTGSNNITTDPLLIDPKNANFKLRPGSPAFGIGYSV